jgi:NAD(P)-dependent dehydrogenase (short-subunit alcohol dehydrogenase family)
VKGQVAVVTGAGSEAGIGFAVARRLHSAGFQVAIASTTDRIHDRAGELDRHRSATTVRIVRGRLCPIGGHGRSGFDDFSVCLHEFALLG